MIDDGTDDRIGRGGNAMAQSLLSAAPILHAAVPTATATAAGSIFRSQWYLQNTGQSGGRAGLDLNVASVWPDYTGAGVRVGVFDDGIDATNREFAGRYDGSRQIGSTNPAGSAASGGVHGTSVAGIIGAANDGIGTVGIAYGATLTGIEVMAGGSALFDAMRVQSRFDVVNHSWGFTGAFADNPLNASWQTSFFAGIRDAADNGRGGLGTLSFVASGNGRASGDSAEAHGFTVDRHVTTVGAVTDQGYVAFYSTGGANLLVSGLSNGGAGAISTTDRTGLAGYSQGDYTGGFGGTSAATPEASGIGALMLEANAGIGWRDAQNILAYSARHVGSAVGGPTQYAERDAWSFNGAGNWNGGGLHFSNDYGNGLLDAHAAVRLAETWLVGRTAQTSANEISVRGSIPNGSYALADGGASEYRFTLGSGVDVEHMVLDLNGLQHGDAGQLTIELTSPSGTVSQLLRNNASGSAISGGWELMSNEFRGEESAGTWTVRIADSAVGTRGTFTGASLTAFGGRHTADDLHVYTDEFGVYGAGTRATLRDADGGIDTLNASPVTTAIAFDLATGGTIAGRAVSVASGTVLENFVAGDGDDRITGNAADNRLLGGRGDDVLDGGAGRNRLEGGAGDDVLFASGIDQLEGGEGYDTATWRNATSRIVIDMANQSRNAGAAAGDSLTGIEKIVGTAYGDEIHAGGGVVRIEAGGGNDVLHGDGVSGAVLSGEAGDDRFIGGAGGQVHDGGEGFDTISFETARSGVTVDFADGSHNRGDAEGDTFEGIEAVQGSRFDDVVRLAGTVRTVDAGAGNDVVQGSAQADGIKGGEGADWIEGGAGADVLDGGAGIDWLSYLASGAAVRVDMVAGVCGGGDAQGDRISNFENVTGSRFADVLFGNNAANTLEGNAGDDEIRGGGGADILRGGDGNDRLFGDDGSDMLVGGAGTNRLTGGAGADLFQVSRIGMQIVEDFTRGQDRIYLQASEFGSILADKRVGADDFAAGARVDFAGRHAGFFFETGSATLYFDADGQGGQAAEAISRIANGHQLQASDFVVA